MDLNDEKELATPSLEIGWIIAIQRTSKLRYIFMFSVYFVCAKKSDEDQSFTAPIQSPKSTQYQRNCRRLVIAFECTRKL